MDFRMAISKMKLVNVVGPAEDVDRICARYLLNRSIHLEHVTAALDNIKGLSPYQDEDPYTEMLARMDDIFRRGKAEPQLKDVSLVQIDRLALEEKLVDIVERITRNERERQSILAEITENEQVIAQLRPLLGVDDVDVENFFHFDFVKFRFGKMPKKSLKTLRDYLDNIDAFFIETSRDEEDVWGMYFMPQALEDKIDAVFSSLYFERTRISEKAHGTPTEATALLTETNEALRRRQDELDEEIHQMVHEDVELLNLMYSQVHLRSRIARIKQYAGHTNESFYIVGWLEAKEAKALETVLEAEAEVVVIGEDPHMVEKITPPTKMKNNVIMRPFELFVKMYGIPSYTEIDPTPIVAISYILMFGIMFGDVGQGLLLAIFGFLFAKLKKSKLGAIVGMAGIVSVACGFVYGSIFGHEVLPTGILHPMDNMNAILIGAVVFGMAVIGFAIVLNIINGIRARDIKRVVFSQNGIAGLLFYFLTIIVAAGSLIGIGISAAPWIIGICIGLPLIAIFLQEPLAMLAERRKNWMPKEKGMFIVESFFEVFEIVLSYVTNTMSFIRVGAFALNHVGMMTVVFLLMKMSGGSIVTEVIGNIVVIGLEGLIVGIQVLRLEYYEMFSRFFTGDGKEFVDINSG